MPTLYHSPASRGLRPLWTIEELGIDCDLALMPYPPRVTSPEFLDINPLGTIPYLVDGDTRMTESMAICVYLASRYGPSPLVVQLQEAGYGDYLDLMEFGEATLTDALGTRVRFLFTQADLGLQAAGELYGERFYRQMGHIEDLLGDGRDTLAAGRFTLADISVCYAVLLARLTQLGDGLPPRVVAYADRQFTRPAFLKAREREKMPAA